MNKKFTHNPWLIFSPFLLYYAYFIIRNKWPSLYGDEIRYVDFAHNLLHGFYSPAAPHINLWNGPGYPIVLAPFILLHIPALYITLMNAVYQYLAAVFLYKAIKLVTGNNKIAALCGLLLAVYPNVLSVLPILYTEAFTDFLVATFVYCIALCYVNKSRKYTLLAGLVLGYLVLTKIIFGYVIILCGAVCLFAFLFRKNKSYYLRPVYVLLVAFAVTVPYLAYTWHVTGKVFYWGNSGGMSLYWMSTPHEHEYGDWKLPDLSNNQYPALYKSVETDIILKKNHAKELKFILRNNEVLQDELFKRQAIKNIENHPLKFMSNYCYNFSRMLFNYPYSYAYQDGAGVRNIVTGSLILWGSVIGIILTWLNWRNVISSVKFLLLITGVYLLLSGALSAYPRQLDVMMPVLLFWAGFLIANIKKPNLRFAPANDPDEIDLMDLTGVEVRAGNEIFDDVVNNL